MFSVLRYWTLKKNMARGSEPPTVAALFESLEPFCEACSLCGAGGGGYAACILRKDTSVIELRNFIAARSQDYPFNCMQLEVTSVAVDNEGLLVDWIEEEDIIDVFARHIV